MSSGGNLNQQVGQVTSGSNEIDRSEDDMFLELPVAAESSRFQRIVTNNE